MYNGYVCVVILYYEGEDVVDDKSEGDFWWFDWRVVCIFCVCDDLVEDYVYCCCEENWGNENEGVLNVEGY